MEQKTEPFDGTYIRAHHNKWHRAVRVTETYSEDFNQHRNRSYFVSECGAKVYSPWGIQQTNNQSLAYGLRGRDLCKRCLKEASPKGN